MDLSGKHRAFTEATSPVTHIGTECGKKIEKRLKLTDTSSR